MKLRLKDLWKEGARLCGVPGSTGELAKVRGYVMVALVQTTSYQQFTEYFAFLGPNDTSAMSLCYTQVSTVHGWENG